MDLFLTNLPTEEFFQTTGTFGLRTEDLDFISNWRPATSSSHLFQTCCAFLDVLGSAFWWSFAGFAYVLQFFAGLSGVFALLRSFLAGKKRRSVFLGTVSLKSFHDEVHKPACASFIVVASYLRTSASQPSSTQVTRSAGLPGWSLFLKVCSNIPKWWMLGERVRIFKKKLKRQPTPKAHLQLVEWLDKCSNQQPAPAFFRRNEWRTLHFSGLQTKEAQKRLRLKLRRWDTKPSRQYRAA